VSESEPHAAGWHAGLAVLGAGLALGLAGLAPWLPADASGLIEVLAWLAPGVSAVSLLPELVWRPSRGDGVRAGLAVLGLWGAAIAGTGLVCAAGLATWDPLGAGVVQAWSGDPASAVALDVSAPVTVTLIQAALVLGAPLYALPLGLGPALWIRLLPRSVRVPGAAALLAVLVGLDGGGLAALGAAVGAGWVVSVTDAWSVSPWPAALGLGALVGLPLLGPLLASGPSALVGWTAPGTLTVLVTSTIVVLLVRPWTRS